MEYRVCEGCGVRVQEEAGEHYTSTGWRCSGKRHDGFGVGRRAVSHSAWVHATYSRFLASGGKDVWNWLSMKGHGYPLSQTERTRILALRRSLIDAVSEPDLRR